MPGAIGTKWVVEQARSLGFSLCGVAPAADFPELERLPEWLARGYAGQMNYLADPRRASPARVLAGARSLIVCALLYNTARPHTAEMAVPRASTNTYRQQGGERISANPQDATPGDAPRAWISRYAWGDDYHRVLGEKLERLMASLRTAISGPFEARGYVDTGPVVERVAAKYAGLGWLGKNTCLIHPQLGSWLFLGVIVTTLDLAPSLRPDEFPQPDLCGQCTLCIDACPTGALIAPYQMDARRCISYLTIEHRGTLPEEWRAAMGAHVFGCDICQDVCPFNHRAPATEMLEFRPRSVEGKIEDRNSKIENRSESAAPVTAPGNAPPPDSLFAPPLEWLASLSEEEYRRAFRESAVKRAKFQGLVRNACVALGNAAGDLSPGARERVSALLGRLADSPDGVIAEHAAWALDRLAGR
ncbi:MAG TPA: tRNA epoxyqueuosine(34) reductase QueG [Candidatus Acidoferrales bacterium]|nr:tRNA epoxyqueuosine(34) reductase QueG [Candidatus Acidoferrales bacterium]